MTTSTMRGRIRRNDSARDFEIDEIIQVLIPKEREEDGDILVLLKLGIQKLLSRLC
jgi:hypothetical protein